ncbi:MAG: DUF4065 domain-containing protein [Deltaproteobacteria bacterium]|nr:DUF4065 domain-containing protein [Deltaproteobacteria bacterium]
MEIEGIGKVDKNVIIQDLSPHSLGKRILKRRDKMLFAAKYLWYADMVAFRDLGKSMTGSAYAALPYGPQLNNYRELIDEIKNADETSA